MHESAKPVHNWTPSASMKAQLDLRAQHHCLCLPPWSSWRNRAHLGKRATESSPRELRAVVRDVRGLVELLLSAALRQRALRLKERDGLAPHNASHAGNDGPCRRRQRDEGDVSHGAGPLGMSSCRPERRGSRTASTGINFARGRPVASHAAAHPPKAEDLALGHGAAGAAALAFACMPFRAATHGDCTCP